MPPNIPLSEWSGSGATRELHETIKAFNDASNRQTKQLLILTWVIAFLTAIMTIGVGVQIWLATRTPAAYTNQRLHPTAPGPACAGPSRAMVSWSRATAGEPWSLCRLNSEPT